MMSHDRLVMLFTDVSIKNAKDHITNTSLRSLAYSMDPTDASGTVIITGANGGLGSAFVDKFLQSSMPYYGVFTVRGRSASSSGTLENIVAEAGVPHYIAQVELDNLASVRAFAKYINAQVAAGKFPRIRALVLNAARQSFKGIQFTADGYEATFAINYVANFILVLLLLESMDLSSGRIVVISSFTYDPELFWNSTWAGGRKLMFEDPLLMAKPPISEANQYVSGMRQYALSKLSMLMFMYSCLFYFSFRYELQRRLDNDPTLNNISILAMDPGGMPATNLSRDAPFSVKASLALIGVLRPIVAYFFPKFPFRTPEQSAGDLIYACFEQEELGAHPKAVYLNGRMKENTSMESKDEIKQKRLWEASIKIAGLRSGDTVLENWK